MAKKSKRKKGLKIIFIILLLSIFLGTFLFFLKTVYEDVMNVDTFYEGTTIAGEDVYGLKKDYAKNKVETALMGNFSSKRLVLEADMYQVELTPDQLGFKPMVDEAVDKAYAVARSGNIIERVGEFLKIKRGMDFPVKYTYDNQKIEEVVKEVASALNKEPTEGSFELKQGKIFTTRGEAGYSVDEADLKAKLTDYIQTQIFQSQNVLKAKVNVREEKPNSDTDYSKINGIISEFSTSLEGSGEDRVHNVEIAAKALNNLLIEPKGVVSFNEETGLRTTSNGYKTASVIRDGKFEDGLGGGVCQVSTTLYNALIRAGVEITERHNHSIPVSYIDAGFDAAVNDSNLDLKFKNPFDYPIFIRSYVGEATVKFFIYGDQHLAEKYSFTATEDKRIRSRNKEVYDEELPSNARVLEKEGHDGISITVYRSKLDASGNAGEKEVFSKSEYPKIDGVYKVGPKAQRPKPSNNGGGNKNESESSEAPEVNPYDPNNKSDPNVPDGY